MTHPIFKTPEYLVIKGFYGSTRAKRSHVLLMNHIDEGLEILQEMGAALSTMKAFCLHPIVQNSEDVWVSWSEAYPLACEYRDRANAYLCRPETDSVFRPADVRLLVGPMSPECRQMLLADKQQNQKDFLIHHYGRHPRTRHLDRYFKRWLRLLKEPQND